MTLSDPNHPLGLAQWLRDHLAGGIAVDAAVLDFAASTFGGTDIAALLEQSDDCEMDSLLELMLFPDQRLQRRYERRWGRIDFTRQDQADVVAHLAAAPLTTGFTTHQTPPVRVEVPAYLIEGFVLRLNITWQPARALELLVDEMFADEVRDSLRVVFRNARLAWRDDQVDLICRYLKKSAAPDPAQDETLSFLLAAVEELPENGAPYDFLTQLKFGRFKDLCKAEDFEAKRHSANMETLMLQGERAAYGNIPDLRRHMRLIDTICLTLFDHTEFFQKPSSSSVAVHSLDNPEAMQAIVKTLL